jgi:hypothetical protein
MVGPALLTVKQLDPDRARSDTTAPAPLAPPTPLL